MGSPVGTEGWLGDEKAGVEVGQLSHFLVSLSSAVPARVAFPILDVFLFWEEKEIGKFPFSDLQETSHLQCLLLS